MVKQHKADRFAQALSERRTHYKMYKAGKNVVYAGITVIAFLTGGFLTQQHNVQAATSETTQTATPTAATSADAADTTGATEPGTSSADADTPTTDTTQTAESDQTNDGVSATSADASTSTDSVATAATAESTTTPAATTQSTATDSASPQPTVESTATTEPANTTSGTPTPSGTAVVSSSTTAVQPATTSVTSVSATAQPAATTASQARAATALTLTPIANLTVDQINVLQNGLTYTTRDGSVLNYYYGAPTKDFNRGSTVTTVTNYKRIADVANVWLVKDGVKKGYIYTNGSGDTAELLVYTANTTSKQLSYSFNSGLTVTAFGYLGNTYAIQGTYSLSGMNFQVLYTMQPNADGTGITVSQTLTNMGASFSAVGIGRFIDTEVGTQDNIPIEYIGNNAGLYVQSGTTSSDYRLNIYFNIENGPTMWTALQTQQRTKTAFYTTFNKAGEENANGAPGTKADPGNLDTGIMMKTPVPGGTWATGTSITMSYTTGLVAANVGTLTQEYKTTTGGTIKDSNTVSGFVKDPVTGAATVDQTLTSGNTTYQLVSVTKPNGTVATSAADIAAALAASYVYTDAPQTIIYTYQAITKAPVSTVSSATITYGQATPAFSLTYGSGLTTANLTQADFAFAQGTTSLASAPTNAGTYTVTLTAAGQAKVQAANPNNSFDTTSFVAGTYTINPKATDPTSQTDTIKTNDQTITFGDATPTFTVTAGSNLTAGGLTNADFTFAGLSTVPTAAGSYSVTLNAAAQAKIIAANPNYVLTAANFIAGTYLIKQKPADPTKATDTVKTDDQTITFGDATPTFTVTTGSNLTGVSLTNADFTFDGLTTIPTDAGSYQVNLTAAAQARIITGLTPTIF